MEKRLMDEEHRSRYREAETKDRETNKQVFSWLNSNTIQRRVGSTWTMLDDIVEWHAPSAYPEHLRMLKAKQ